MIPDETREALDKEAGLRDELRLLAAAKEQIAAAIAKRTTATQRQIVGKGSGHGIVGLIGDAATGTPLEALPEAAGTAMIHAPYMARHLAEKARKSLTREKVDRIKKRIVPASTGSEGPYQARARSSRG